ncbi:MAG: winged helix-turn-helix domain-containing protein [Lachnospira eligens]
MKIGESKEDYLEAAYVLKRQKGYVRNSMLSDYLNYSKASVSVAVRGLLADSSRQVVTHEIIFEQLWKEPYGDDSANMIWCFVRRLRKKMEKTEPEAAKIIQSIRKVGYYLDIDRERTLSNQW